MLHIVFFLKATWNEVCTLKSEPSCNSIIRHLNVSWLLLFLMIVSTKLYSTVHSVKRRPILNVWESLLGLFLGFCLFVFLSSTCSCLGDEVFSSSLSPFSNKHRIRVKGMGKCNACRDSLHWQMFQWYWLSCPVLISDTESSP